MISPLGKYSEAAAALTAVGIVMVALVAHMGILGVVDTAWLDTTAGVAVGVILGQRQSTNGAGKLAAAAHVRLDALGAPPAGIGEA